MADLKRWSEDELARMRRTMDQLFDDLCQDYGMPPLSTGSPKVSREGDLLVIRAAVPGCSPEDIEINIEDGYMFLSGRIECSSQRGSSVRTFRHRVRLPARVDPSGAEAVIEDDVLTVRVPLVLPSRQRILIVSKR
jgi:HSP20 family protein